MEEFNKRFFTGKKITWFGDKGVLNINEKINATITIVDETIQDHKIGYRVDIINKNDGKIDSHLFKFNSYLQNRIDDRKNYKGGFQVVTYVSNDWYIAIPNKIEIKNMANKIFEYINMWK